MTKLEYHPLANLFPMITDEEQLAAFRASIAADGVRKPVVLFEGKILDGRNRYEAAMLVPGFAAIPTRVFGSDPADGDDPLRFVMRENAERRHLTDDQRRRIAAKIATMGSGRKSGEVSPMAKPDGVTREEATTVLNTDKAGVDRAKAVYARGTPELQRAMDSDQVSVRTAADVARLPPHEQRKVVAAGPEAMRQAAGGVRHAAKAERALKAVEGTSAPTGEPSLTGTRPRLPLLQHASGTGQVHVQIGTGPAWVANWSEGEWRPGWPVLILVARETRPAPEPQARPVPKPSGTKKGKAAKSELAEPGEDALLLEPYGQGWWTFLIRKATKGESVRLMLDWASQGRGWTVKRNEAPDLAEMGELEVAAIDSDVFKRAETVFRQRTGKALPRPEAPAEVWLPRATG